MTADVHPLHFLVYQHPSLLPTTTHQSFQHRGAAASGSRLAAKPVGLVLNVLRLERLPTKIVHLRFFQVRARHLPMNILIHVPSTRYSTLSCRNKSECR